MSEREYALAGWMLVVVVVLAFVAGQTLMVAKAPTDCRYTREDQS